ncbi:hypothetical protein Tco_1485225 [Tanacetum coccineum]
MDISTDIKNGYHDSEGDIIYLESLLVDDTIPNLPPEVFLDHDPKNLKDEPDNEDLKSMDHRYLSLTYVIRNFLPYFTYPMDSSLPLSSESEDIIFDPGISAYSFYSLAAGALMKDLLFHIDHFVEIPSSESKVDIEVLPVLWGNRLPIPDGSLPLSRTSDVAAFKKVEDLLGHVGSHTDVAVV